MVAWRKTSGTYIGLHGPEIGGEVVRRLYFQWGEDAKEDKAIKQAHLDNKLPWVSFKPSGPLSDITAGLYDEDIRVKARRYNSYTRPVLTTFFHEPVGDVDPKTFNSAFLHIRRTMLNENPLRQTAFVPILNGYLWADWYKGSKGRLDEWVTDRLVAASPLFGADHYGDPHEIRRMFDYLKFRGVKSIGIAEFGRDQGAAVFEEKIRLFEEYREDLNVVAYFNSRIQEFGSIDSPLGSGTFEREVYKEYMAGSLHI